nr:MAG TPA: hypothetical protein [Caudoviricetes sp.]
MEELGVWMNATKVRHKLRQLYIYIECRSFHLSR